MKLETERLILREAELSDVKELVENLNNIKISGWIATMPYPYEEKDAKWWLDENEKKKKANPRRDYHFRIVLKETGEVIGSIGIFGFDENKVKSELGYWLAEPYWRKGYMKEAVKEIIKFGFEKLGVGKINIPAFSTNIGSNELARSLGFTLEGKLRKNARCMANGNIHDENVWGLLREEYNSSYK